MKRVQAVSQVQIDDNQVIVTLWNFPPGSETGWHRHAHDYVIVPVQDGHMLLETPDGEKEVRLKAGECYKRGEGVEHNVINIGEGPFSFVELDFDRLDSIRNEMEAYPTVPGMLERASRSRFVPVRARGSCATSDHWILP
ncbi:cupin domain-containing protein (plasmid) [Halomonas sp. PA16-9]|nr:cupin domain-containing protein [Halomonas sp. PA16-9]